MTDPTSRRLAIDGGEPAFPEGPPGWPIQDEAVRDALAAAFASGDWGRYDGPLVHQLVERLASQHSVSHVHLCSSGTIAVELALRGLKIGDGDEVIVAAYDFPGNFRCIEAVGARPVLVDLAAGGWTIDAATIEQTLSPQVKAVIVSHLHGSLADMRAIRELADWRGFAVVEDACQATGAMVQGKPAGSWGDAGVLSFGGSKLLTAGRGGAVLTNRDDLAQRIRVYSDRGNDAFPLSQLQAAALLPQLDLLSVRNAARLQSVQHLSERLGETTWITNQFQHPQGQASPLSAASNQPAFYKLAWRIGPEGDNQREAGDVAPLEAIERVRRWFTTALRAEGVAMDEGFRGFVRRSSSRCRSVGSLSNAAAAAAGTVILHHPVLLHSLEYLDRLAAVIRAVAAEIPERLKRASTADE